MNPSGVFTILIRITFCLFFFLLLLPHKSNEEGRLSVVCVHCETKQSMFL